MQVEIHGLLFDNDGVLVDSHGAAKQAWDRWAIEFGKVFNIDDNAGRRAQDLVLEMVGEELFEFANDRINQLEQDSAHQTIALPGAVDLLTGLPAGAWTVCTSANPNLGRARLAAAGLPIPSELVTAYDVERGKPHPDPYLLGARRLKLRASECVVFEDADAGVQAAKAAGAGFIVGVSERAIDTKADVVVKDLTGIRFERGSLVIPESNRLR
jgi:sugar-phosphatase